MTKIREIMTTDVETCTLQDSVYDVAIKMKEENVGVIPIVDDEKLVGVITDRDIVLRCIAEKESSSAMVADVMSGNLITISSDSTTNEAAHLMAEHQIRRLPVVENDRLVGIVALGDLAVRDLTDSQAKQALSEISETNETHLQH
ncbi:CBS domain-containing protein [Bacillus chungangensis]|uniref:CBS domain-containing protein n=1 Tax=Bacillus chungangensis TaxID=587633 RepID=A0ABT9WX39_9BACI|nr:CBS domain-containing protein [Bacillus chungangensis]MDQ0177694.1 CBS domain-containing protein [Bacillus chungangensis]